MVTGGKQKWLNFFVGYRLGIQTFQNFVKFIPHKNEKYLVACIIITIYNQPLDG